MIPALTVGQIMTREVTSLEADHSINLAAAVMEWRHIRHLPVVRNGKLLGLVTHRDLAKAQAHLLALPARELLKDGAQTLSVPVVEIMRREIWCVTASTPVLEAARIMVDHKFGCLPVVDDQERLVGIVTQIDLLRMLVDALSVRRDREDTNPRIVVAP